MSTSLSVPYADERDLLRARSSYAGVHEKRDLDSCSRCIVNEPIRNKVNPSSISFYVHFDRKLTSPHYYHIEAHSVQTRSDGATGAQPRQRWPRWLSMPRTNTSIRFGPQETAAGRPWKLPPTRSHSLHAEPSHHLWVS